MADDDGKDSELATHLGIIAQGVVEGNITAEQGAALAEHYVDREFSPESKKG